MTHLPVRLAVVVVAMSGAVLVFLPPSPSPATAAASAWWWPFLCALASLSFRIFLVRKLKRLAVEL